jgi:hypothetical protein
MALTSAGLLPFSFLKENSSLTFIVNNLIVLGFGFALFSSPNTNAIMSCVSKRFYGLASGSVGTMRLMGMMISMGIATLVFALYIGRVPITTEHFPTFIESVRAAFWIFSLLCICGVFASLARGNIRMKGTKVPEKELNKF